MDIVERLRANVKGFVRKGFCEEPDFRGNATWTPLGLAVLALLEKNSPTPPN